MENTNINKFNHSKIYKIKCLNTNKEYIGSTTEGLNQRLARHKRHYNSYLSDNMNYVYSFEIIKEGNYTIELIEECNFNTKDELRQREQYYITFYPNCINKNNSFRTPEILKAQRDKDNLLWKTRHPEAYKEASIKRSIKVICPHCSINITKRNTARHNKTFHS